jgi:hypothetical protein
MATADAGQRPSISGKGNITQTLSERGEQHKPHTLCTRRRESRRMSLEQPIPSVRRHDGYATPIIPGLTPVKTEAPTELPQLR